MNSEIAGGTWQQLRGSALAQWGRVRGDALRVMTGRHLQLVGRLRAACGRSTVEVGRQIDDVLTAAIRDRPMHHSMYSEFRGRSYRLKVAANRPTDGNRSE